MKKLFISFAIAVMAFVSCSKEALNESAIETKSYSLTAIAPGDDQTKTSLQKGEGTNWNVLWSENDALKVKVSGDGTSKSHYANYTLESGAGTGNAIFRGSVEAPDEVFAFYPSSLVGTINSYGMFFDIPKEQIYSSTGEVSNNSLPMWANGDRTNLTFNHICSIIRIPVWINQSGVELLKVTLSSNKNISGQWYFGTNFNKPLPASNARKSIILNCGDLELSTSESEPTILNFVAAVGSDSWGDLEITFCFSDGSAFTKSTSSLSAATKGKVYKLATLELSRVASDMQIQIDGGSWVNWDGVSDIATPESSVAVKGTDTKLTRESMRIIMSKVKSGSATIDLDFSSVRCDFSTIETNDDLFADNKKIGNLKLPAGITTLRSSSFSATSVEKVTLPVSVTNVESYVFDSSTSSGRFDVDTSHPTYCAIDGQLYKKHSGKPTPQTYTLVQVASGTSGVFSVAENTTAIEENAFKWCNRITAINIPVTVTEMKRNSTYLMTSVKNITLLCETPPTLGLKTGSHWENNQYFPGWSLKAGTTKTITVPAGCLEAYTGTEGNRTDWWKQYHDIAGFEFTTE